MSPLVCQNASVLFRFSREIHIWGGLGSQLYGLALALDIRERMPSYRNKLVFHTSGVTERQLEIGTLLNQLGFEYVEKLDFVSDHSDAEIASNRINLLVSIRRVVVYILRQSRIIAGCNYRTDAKFWTTQIRGHYAYRKISKKTLGVLFDGLELGNNDANNKELTSRIVVHYRLGDLLLLEEKGEIALERLSSAIFTELKNNQQTKNLLVLTDSPEVCRTRFNSVILDLESLGVSTTISSESSIQTIVCGVKAESFIGTNSKISFWIIYFRDLINPSSNRITSYAPIENVQAITSVIEGNFSNHRILYF